MLSKIIPYFTQASVVMSNKQNHFLCVCNASVALFAWVHAHAIGRMEMTVQTWEKYCFYVVSLQKLG